MTQNLQCIRHMFTNDYTQNIKKIKWKKRKNTEIFSSQKYKLQSK